MNEIVVRDLHKRRRDLLDWKIRLAINSVLFGGSFWQFLGDRKPGEKIFNRKIYAAICRGSTSNLL
jgi:hypothetical protein